MLRNRNTGTGLVRSTKNEPLPVCISEDVYLAEKYYKTDLTMKYVFDQCLGLKPLKGVEVTPQIVEFWFKEFVRRGWTRHYFDKRLEAVKHATIYGSFIDFSTWYKAEALYTEFEANQMIESIIEGKIREAEMLKQNKIKLTEEQERYILYAAAQNFMAGCNAEMRYKLDEEIEKEHQRLLRLLKTKKVAIGNMAHDKRNELFELAKAKGEIKPTNEAEGLIMKQYLEEFASLISDDTVNAVLEDK